VNGGGRGFGETPKPATETVAIPGKSIFALLESARLIFDILQIEQGRAGQGSSLLVGRVHKPDSHHFGFGVVGVLVSQPVNDRGMMNGSGWRYGFRGELGGGIV